MNKNEQLLIEVLKSTTDRGSQALILQAYIQRFGPLPNDVGDKVKNILEGNKNV